MSYTYTFKIDAVKFYLQLEGLKDGFSIITINILNLIRPYYNEF